MPLPLTVSCFSKIQIGFTFLIPALPGSPGQRAIKWVCLCVVLLCQNDTVICRHIQSFKFVCNYDGSFFTLDALAKGVVMM